MNQPQHLQTRMLETKKYWEFELAKTFVILSPDGCIVLQVEKFMTSVIIFEMVHSTSVATQECKYFQSWHIRFLLLGVGVSASV